MQILNFDPVSWVVVDPGIDPGTRGLVVNAVAVETGVDPVCNASLVCEPIGPEIVCEPIDPETVCEPTNPKIVFDPLLVGQSTAKSQA